MTTEKTYRGRRLEDGKAVLDVETVSPSGRRQVRLLRHSFRRGDRCHSPTGFDFGYSGSGPSELTRSLLEDATTPCGRRYLRRPSVSLAFKQDVTAGLAAGLSRCRGAQRRWGERYP